MKIEEVARRTSMDSTIKSFNQIKEGRGGFQALISNHVDEAKY